MHPEQFISLDDPAPHLYVLVLAIFTAAMCMVAIWAGTSQRHWFVRAFGIWSSLALLLPLRAYAPIWIFALSSPLIAIIVCAINSWHTECLEDCRDRQEWADAKRRRWMFLFPSRSRRRVDRTPEEVGSDQRFQSVALRFRTTDLLLATLVVAAATAVLVETGHHDRPELSNSGLALMFVCIAVLVWTISLGRRGWTLIVLLSFLLPAVATGFLFLQLSQPLSRWMIAVVAGHTLLALEVALILIVFLVLLDASRSPHPRWRRAGSRTALAAAMIAYVIPLVSVYLQLAWQTPEPPRLLVQGNHYGRILEIAEQANRINPNQSVLVELLHLVAEPNAVDYALYRDDDAAIVDDIRLFRALARSLDAETSALAAQASYDHAADYAAANVQLGALLQRGGVNFHAVVGASIEGLGYVKLTQLRIAISSAKREKLQATLATIASGREDIDTRKARTAAHRAQSPWTDRLQGLVVNLRNQLYGIQYGRWVDRRDVIHRLLRTDLAIREYARDHDRLPSILSELVPTYLSHELIDSYSGRPLIYRIADSQFTLYSVGWDGQDNGGHFASMREYENSFAMQPGLDFDLDTLTRP